MDLVLYKLKCLCGKYETTFDMTFGTAKAAADMHLMLDGRHEITFFQKPDLVVAKLNNFRREQING